MKMEWRKKKKNPTQNQPSPGEYEERVSTFDIGQWELDVLDDKQNKDLDVSEMDIARTLSYDVVDNTCESVFGTPTMPQTSHLSRLHEKSHCHLSPTTDH
jgi:hypothetical protein